MLVLRIIHELSARSKKFRLFVLVWWDVRREKIICLILKSSAVFAPMMVNNFNNQPFCWSKDRILINVEFYGRKCPLIIINTKESATVQYIFYFFTLHIVKLCGVVHQQPWRSEHFPCKRKFRQTPGLLSVSWAKNIGSRMAY